MPQRAPISRRGRPRWRVPPISLFDFRQCAIRLDLSVTSTIPMLQLPNALSRPSPRLGRPQVNDVIESGKYHQHYDNRETDSKPDLLGALRQRPAAHGLDRIEQKVTAIE